MPPRDFDEAVRPQSADPVPGRRVAVRVNEEAERVHRGRRIPALEGGPVHLREEREVVDVVGDAEADDVHVRIQAHPGGLGRDCRGLPVPDAPVDCDRVHRTRGVRGAEEGQEEQSPADERDHVQFPPGHRRFPMEPGGPETVRESVPVREPVRHPAAERGEIVRHSDVESPTDLARENVDVKMPWPHP